ncbi:MAG: hypothetical protein ACKVOO_00475 [Burkholderiaceae bacterium]
MPPAAPALTSAAAAAEQRSATAWRSHVPVWLLRGTAWATALAGLWAVFALYTQPDFLITLATMAWTCF